MAKKESYKSIRNKSYKKYKGLSSSDAGYNPYEPTPSNLPAGFTAPKGAVINQGKGNFTVTSSNIGGGKLTTAPRLGNYGGGFSGTGAQWAANQAREASGPSASNPTTIPAWSQNLGGGATSRGPLTKKRSMKKKTAKKSKKHGKKR